MPVRISNDPSELNDLMYKPAGTKVAFNVEDITYHQRKAWLYASRAGAKITCSRGFLIIDSECTVLSVITVVKQGSVVKTRGPYKDSSKLKPKATKKVATLKESLKEEPKPQEAPQEVPTEVVNVSSLLTKRKKPKEEEPKHPLEVTPREFLVEHKPTKKKSKKVERL
jgi:hypothetical protein